MKQIFLSVMVLVLVSSCGGNDDGPSIPEGANLIFPEENSECTTGVSVNEALSQVTFEWQASKNTDTYRLNVVNLESNIPQEITTAATSASLSIAKGTPFSWSVTSVNSRSDETTSETWLFYNAGSQTTYAPFPAQLVSPVSGSTAVKNLSNEVTLTWRGADVDNDIVSFQIFFSEENPPTAILGTTAANIMELDTSVESNTVYFWRVVTTDSEGNTSDSGIFEFKVF
ncbi:hypothetical protein LV716_05590 [Flagellimonas sp. HMM57]|uniref:hypothetical protein n=1 Tax=unclassified Flagellimonas TaxID=2644544 RepID=UPI0013D316B0|nr:MULTISPECIES: hypothetical protein [unclassified Flagellimonas]UII77244.1 hypothetical protein LV716_05590 [Flagellimonas sp. HMM57]